MAEHTNLTRSTIKGAAWLGSSSIIRLMLRIASVAILARLLSPTDYGIATAALVVVDFALMLGNLGLSQALVQREVLERRHTAAAVGVALISIGILVTAMWFAAPAFAALFAIEELTEVTRVLTIMVLFRIFGGIGEALLARHMKVQLVAISSLASLTIAAFLVAVPLAYAGAGYWALVAMSITETAVSMGLFCYFARHHLPRPGLERKALRELMSVSLGFAVISPPNFLNNNIDRLLLARLLGAAELGIYSRAAFLKKTAANMFNNIARVAAFPAMARVQSDKDRLRTATTKGLALTALIAIPAGAYCALFAAELIDILLGDQWTQAATPFAIFGAALYPTLGQRVCATLYQALGRLYALLPIHLFNLAALVTAIWFLAPYGLDVICLGIAAVAALRFALIAFKACRLADVSLGTFASLHVAPLVVTAGLLGVGIPLKLWLGDMNALLLLVTATPLMALPAVILLMIRPSLVLGPAGLDAARQVFGDRLSVLGRRIRFAKRA